VSAPVRVAFAGPGRRCRNYYLPAAVAMGLEVRGFCGRSAERTRELAARYGARPYETLDDLLDDGAVDLVVGCVAWSENAGVYRRIAGSDAPALLETPLAPTLADAEDVACLLSRRKAPTLVAEQYHLRPVEVVKRRLIADGVFGDVTYAFSDGLGHEFHAISVIRSYLGFDQRLDRVAAMQQRAKVGPHALNRQRLYPWEQTCHALLRFTSGAQATYHWTWLAYDSPIRPHRVAGFHGTLGAARGEECVVLEDPSRPARHLRIERRTRSVDGVEVPFEHVALLGTRVLATWSNPHPDLVLTEEQAVAATLLGNLLAAARGEEAPLYTPALALEDHRIAAAMRRAVETAAWQRPAG
jgi:predicted dehydrogenase